ncbi:hypothetical protein BC629DRAFT_1440080 [Irpex lacteus]|nr:hypothetical protein BC629DRAFT_1440080 [Irpex lacteus]
MEDDQQDLLDTLLTQATLRETANGGYLPLPDTFDDSFEEVSQSSTEQSKLLSCPPPLRRATVAEGVAIDGQLSVAEEKRRAKNRKRKERYKRNRKLKEERTHTHVANIVTKPSQAENHPLEVLEMVKFDTQQLRSAQGGWIGRDLPRQGPPKDLEYYLQRGYRLIEWDGQTSKVLVDSQDRIFGCLAHPPNEDGSWSEVHKGFTRAAEELFASLGPTQEAEERRGDYESITCGLSMGQGQKAPQILHQSERNQQLLDKFNADPYVHRVVTTANSMFHYYFPKLYKDYVDVLHQFHKLTGLLKTRTRVNGGPGDDDPDWDPPLGGAWAAECVNAPPKVATEIHVDQANKANGICPIFSYGDYNPKTSGHLVLPELQAVIEFPAACFIFIPSATLMHGNTLLHEGDVRGSLTMFTAGSLFRWVAYGGRTEKELKKMDPGCWVSEEVKRKGAWAESMNRFSTTASLHYDRLWLRSQGLSL